uniref:Scavenger receptor class F member 2-like n=1 Tax=Crassostrea virginica TaxID=6565 RepID=A0A8B8BY99_CRAVI|nr:scavenger receptor class F member 2-like [Crassostrea virginica]
MLDNLALNKTAWQKYPYEARWGAYRAVDGLYTRLDIVGDQCTVSGNRKSTAEWRVDLGGVFSIHHIFIQYRTDNFVWNASNGYTGRFLGYSVYLSNTTNKEDGVLCFRDTNYTPATIPNPVNISCHYHGRYVIYYNNRTHRPYPEGYSDYAYNELCEVEALGCPIPGYYGESCSTPCPQNCLEGHCHITEGTCLGCLPGYNGPRCDTKCNDFKYGLGCNKTCGKCYQGEPCDHVTGVCLNGCDAGVYGDKCMTECQVGSYGSNCRENCSVNCGLPKTCNRETGRCTSRCQPGWDGITCKTKCSNYSYGPVCNQTCGQCLDDLPCHHVNGSCLGGCAPGFERKDCKTACSNNTYGLHCTLTCGNCSNGQQCHHVTGTCPQGCVQGYDGDTCDTRLKIMYVTANEQVGIAFYGLLAPLIVSVLCNAWCLMRMLRKKRQHQRKETRADNPNSPQEPGPLYDDMEESPGYQELGEVSKPSTYEKLT